MGDRVLRDEVILLLDVGQRVDAVAAEQGAAPLPGAPASAGLLPAAAGEGVGEHCGQRQPVPLHHRRREEDAELDAGVVVRRRLVVDLDPFGVDLDDP